MPHSLCATGSVPVTRPSAVRSRSKLARPARPRDRELARRRQPASAALDRIGTERDRLATQDLVVDVLPSITASSVGGNRGSPPEAAVAAAPPLASRDARSATEARVWPVSTVTDDVQQSRTSRR